MTSLSPPATKHLPRRLTPDTWYLPEHRDCLAPLYRSAAFPATPRVLAPASSISRSLVMSSANLRLHYKTYDLDTASFPASR
jgi:hypothetical protein